MSGNGSGNEDGLPQRLSGRGLAIAVALAGLVLALVGLVGPQASVGQPCDPVIESCTTSGSDGTTTSPPPEPDWFVSSHVIGRGTIKEGTSNVCAAGATAAETAVKDCSEGAYDGMDITYSAVAATGFTFVGWSGACSGTGTCTLHMDSDKDVTARFMDDSAPSAPAIGLPASDGTVTHNDTGVIAARATSSDATVDHITCAVDGAPVSCTSGTNFATPAKETGTYTITATATDFRGLTSAVTSRTYKIARMSHAGVTGSPADGSVTSSRTTSVSISGDHGATVFECSLDDGAHWASCPVPLSAANLGVLENSGTGQLNEGHKTLRVRSGVVLDGQTYFGDPTAAVHWTVDATKPVTTITSGPLQGDLSNQRNVTFTFSQADANPGSFQCSMDSATFGACPGGQAGKAIYSSLSLATHTFKVRSTDQAGNVEDPAKSVTWKITADADNDGSPVPGDCNDADPAIHPGAVEINDNSVDENCDGILGVNLDRDGDGVQRPADCNDNDASIHPGAYDKPGDTIDQDCAGGPADYGTPATRFISTWAPVPGGTAFPKFTVVGAPAHGKVTLSCTGKGCRFKRMTLKFKKGVANLTKQFKKTRLRKGAVLTLQTTAPDMFVATSRMTITKAAPKLTKVCARPGAKKTFKCV
jgi:uncharacterized repeat protein (TIGR02543 family)